MTRTRPSRALSGTLATLSAAIALLVSAESLANTTPVSRDGGSCGTPAPVSDPAVDRSRPGAADESFEARHFAVFLSMQRPGTIVQEEARAGSGEFARRRGPGG